MSELAVPVVAIALCVLAYVALLRLVNLRRVNRARQFPVPVAAAVYAVCCLVTAVLLDGRLAALIAEEGADARLAPLAWNALAALVFIVVKLFCLALSRRWRKPSLMEGTSARWYELDEDTGNWFLRKRFCRLRVLASATSWVVALVCALALSLPLAWDVPEASPAPLMLPVLALALSTELYNFLNGLTKEEWRHDVGGEPISAMRVNAYHKLRAIYERLLPAPLLSSYTSVSFGGKVGGTDLVERLRRSDDARERVVGAFFDGLSRENGFFDVDRMRATVTLMHGESVVFFNPHYRDLGEYVLLPLVDVLVNNRTCLVVVGRSASCEDVSAWVSEVLSGYCHTGRLWRVERLGRTAPDCEVGVLSFSNLYDVDVLSANAEFFSRAGLVLLVEPSNMLATSQVGLQLLAERVAEKDPGAPAAVYCVCDHETDGLVDTLSHVLQTSITHACAGPVPRSIYTTMGWSASGDFNRHQLFGGQTRYLGNGVELAAIALKNNIPDAVWLSEGKAPVQDVRWIAGQYYPQICAYANLPVQQSSLDGHISYESGLWSLPVAREAFVIAEDELDNMFATMRAYLARGEEHSFVNVISENYLMRDYMRYNKQLFMNDPKAIPAIAPHYAKTERNTVLRLILAMTCGPVEEERVARELDLVGLRSDDVYRELARLIEKHTGVRETIVSVRVTDDAGDRLAPVRRTEYSVARPLFDRLFASTLKSAYFVVEDERLEAECIDALLFGHITQVVMPGQHLTYGGKYYKVHAVSPRAGCVLHRAADSYTGREYYRQLRTYTFGRRGEVIRSRRVMDVDVTLEQRDFWVSSTGYLRMDDLQDLRTARLVDLSRDPSVGSYRRSYANKNVLRIELPETSVRERFTLCLLLAELSRTLFPNAWPYLAFLAARPDDVEGMLDRFCYRVEGEVDDALYVVEDSDMDLGLIEAVDDSLSRMFEMLADYLDWHFEKMREPASKDPVPSPIIVPPGQKSPVRPKPSAIQRVAERIQRLLERFRKRGRVEDPAEPNAPEPNASKSFASKPQDVDPVVDPVSAASTSEPAPVAEPVGTPAPEPTVVDGPTPDPAAGNPIAEKPADAPGPGAPRLDPRIPSSEVIRVVDDGPGLSRRDLEDAIPIELMPEYRIRPSRYQRECFLKFGFEDIDERLAIEELSTYLTVRGWGDNDLTHARKRQQVDFAPLDLNCENHCDFCGVPLSGVSFERLQDGRVRCNDCSSTAINDVEEYRQLFRRCETMMQFLYDITISVPITVEMVDARTVAKKAGMIFRPTTDVAPRVLGFARKRGNEYSLVIENGSPRLAAIDTTVHELTHLWQYLNWDDREINRLYAMPEPPCTERARLILYEGMAMWSSVQLLYSMGETHYARQQESLALQRRDEYGVGFALYRDRFGFRTGGEELAFTPFSSFPPIEPEELRKATKLLCVRGDACEC